MKWALVKFMLSRMQMAFKCGWFFFSSVQFFVLEMQLNLSMEIEKMIQRGRTMIICHYFIEDFLGFFFICIVLSHVFLMNFILKLPCQLMSYLFEYPSKMLSFEYVKSLKSKLIIELTEAEWSNVGADKVFLWLKSTNICLNIQF